VRMMYADELNNSVAGPAALAVEELQQLHREAIGQLKDISYRMDHTEAKLSNIDMHTSQVL